MSWAMRKSFWSKYHNPLKVAQVGVFFLIAVFLRNICNCGTESDRHRRHLLFSNSSHYLWYSSWGKQKPLPSSRSWDIWQLCNLPTDLFLFPLPGGIISNQDSQDPAFHSPQPMEATSSCDPRSHTLDNLPAAALGRNGHLKISSFLPTPKNVDISPQNPQLSGSAVFPYLSLFQPLWLYPSVYVLPVWSARSAREHWPTRKKKKRAFLWSIRLPEIQQPNFFPHLSILD